MPKYCSQIGCKNGAISQAQAEEIEKLFGKPYCSEHVKDAWKEAEKATESLISPKEQAIAWLARQGFKESKTKGLWVLAGETEIAVNFNSLSDEFPHALKIGRLETNGTITETGHGLARIDDVRSMITNLMKPKGAGKNDKKEQTPAPIEKFDAVLPAIPHENLIKKAIKEHEAAKINETAKPEPKGEMKKMNEVLPAKKEYTKLPAMKHELTLEEIKQYLCPTATDAEAYMFLQLCLYRDLNPWTKEVYLIKYGDKVSMVVGKDAFTRKAEESSDFDGFEAGVIVTIDGQFEERTGTIVRPKEELIGGWAKVYRKSTSRPFEVKVGFAEYDKKMNNWKTMPGTMIRKVALVQALREAFTKELGGCYDKVELDAEAEP